MTYKIIIKEYIEYGYYITFNCIMMDYFLIVKTKMVRLLSHYIHIYNCLGKR